MLGLSQKCLSKTKDIFQVLTTQSFPTDTTVAPSAEDLANEKKLKLKKNEIYLVKGGSGVELDKFNNICDDLKQQGYPITKIIYDKENNKVGNAIKSEDRDELAKLKDSLHNQGIKKYA